MDYGLLIAGIVGASIGGGIVAGATRHLNHRLIMSLREHAQLQKFTMDLLAKRLGNLRANAFLTNEHGHRVRYSKASAEVRARAEAGE